MYTSLIDAPVNTDLILLEVKRPQLATWLYRLGLFAGSHLRRHDEEFNYHPVRVRGSRGDVVVPAGLAIKIFVHVDSGERKPLVEMQRKEHGHIESISCGKGCGQGLEHLGLAEETEVVCIRNLPHMDYVTVINGGERTRLSEGEAARIWGSNPDSQATQFYFARKDIPFLVVEIIGGRKAQEHLETHGIRLGCTLRLEAIEQAQDLHAPGVAPITISSPGGLRLYLNPSQAEQILVKSASQTVASGDTAPRSTQRRTT